MALEPHFFIYVMCSGDGLTPKEGAASLSHGEFTTGVVDHLRLTVADVSRARAFYTEVLGFTVAMEIPPGVLLSNGAVLLGLGPSPDPERSIHSDRFDENRIGLDHLSFAVATREELVYAKERFDDIGVPHGEIKDLGPELGIYVLSFRDPDNIQLELTAPYKGTK